MKIGLPLSIWYWTVTTTASNTNLCLSKPCRNVCADKLRKHFRPPLKVLWRSRARLLNLSSSLDPIELVIESRFFSSAFLINNRNISASNISKFDIQSLEFFLQTALAKHLKGIHASLERSWNMNTLRMMHRHRNLVLCRCMFHFMGTCLVVSWQGFVFVLVHLIIRAVDRKTKYFQVLWICYVVIPNDLLWLQSCNPPYPFPKRLSLAIVVADSFESWWERRCIFRISPKEEMRHKKPFQSLSRLLLLVQLQLWPFRKEVADIWIIPLISQIQRRRSIVSVKFKSPSCIGPDYSVGGLVLNVATMNVATIYW